MNSTRRWTLLAACAFLVSCATPGPPPRARVAVELLQGFPASTLVPALTSGAREEHVILLIDATASMQRTDDTSPESNALAASSAASRLIGSLGQERSVDVWTLGASEADCAPAWRGMPFEDPERAARAGEGSLADALVRIAAGLEDARFDWQTGDAASLSEQPIRVAVFTNLGGECGGDLCGAVGRLVEAGAKLELTLFGDTSAPMCLAELQVGDTPFAPNGDGNRRPGPARFWVESVNESERTGEGVLAAGRTDGAPRTLLAGRVYVHVELDQPTRFGPIDLAPNTETLLRIIDFPGLVPSVRELSWKTRDVPLALETPASIAP